MTTDYSEKLNDYMGKAQEHARYGEIIPMLIFLENAIICAEGCEEDITEWGKEIKNHGYTNAVPILIEEAKISALEGNLVKMYLSFKEAQIYAKQIGEDISDKVREIKYLTLN